MRFSRMRTWLVAATVATGVACSGDEPAAPARAKPQVAVAPPAPVVAPAPPAVIEPPAATIALPEAPEPPALVIPDGYRARMKYARQLARESRPDDAEAVYAKAAELEPTRAAPRIEIARLRLEAKDVGSARKHAEAAVELEPGASGAWNTLGRVELMDGDKLAAVAAFEKATEVNPDNSYAWNNLGLTLSQLARWDEAVAALERATGGDKPEPYMWTNLGVAYEHHDQPELARAAYRQAAKAGSKVAADSLARLDAAAAGTGVRAEAPGGAPRVDQLPPDAGTP